MRTLTRGVARRRPSGPRKRGLSRSPLVTLAHALPPKAGHGTLLGGDDVTVIAHRGEARARRSRLHDPTGHFALSRGRDAKSSRRRGIRVSPCSMARSEAVRSRVRDTREPLLSMARSEAVRRVELARTSRPAEKQTRGEAGAADEQTPRSRRENARRGFPGRAVSSIAGAGFEPTTFGL